MKNVLQGIRVVDLSLLLPGPYCTHLLAKYGADVIAIKPPSGDLLETVGGHFAHLHHHKTVHTMNLKQPEGIQALHRLLQNADIFVEGFRPGAMARLGLDYTTLTARYPRLIYCSISGYGQDGPQRDIAGHDLNYLAASGLLHDLIHASGTSFIPPLPLADFVGGALAALQEIAFALYHREKTGHGCHLDIAMADKLKELLLFLPLAQASACPSADGNPKPFLPFFLSPRYAIYESKDGTLFALGCIENKFWKNFCEAVERPEWLDPHRYPAAAHAGLSDDGLRDALTQLFHAHPHRYWEQLGEQHDICLTRVLSYSDTVKSAHTGK